VGLPVYSLSVPNVGLGLAGFAAEDSGGAELCSLAPPEVSAPAGEVVIEFVAAAPEEGGAELCSFAPPEVSAPPEGGLVAWFAAPGVAPG
jgi:hypothetical protein